MNNLFILILISILLLIYGFFKSVSILWLCFLVLPRKKLSPHEEAKKTLEEIRSHFPDYPDLDVIDRFIDNISADTAETREEYICQILDDLYFMKPNPDIKFL